MKLKKQTVSKLIVLLAALTLVIGMIAGCGSSNTPAGSGAAPAGSAAVADADAEAAANVDALIAAIQVQEWTEGNDERCAEAKAAWDALTDAQKELVEEADYFGRDTGDASLDDPRNQDEIGENELLVVSFGTSFNDSRVKDIKGVEDALAAAYPDWSVRRAFTAQIIINHILARDGESIDNVEQALERAVANGVKNLVIQPTHLMHGNEYEELVGTLEGYKDKFASVKVAEPLLGEVGADTAAINADKEAAAKALVAEAAKVAGYDSADAAAADGVAFVFMGHGTSHEAAITYDQMQTQMAQLGYKNVFIGTVEGNPADTALPEVKKAVEAAGFTKIVLRPMMVVAGDHANNDMAADEEGSWYYGFVNGGEFEVEGADAPVEIGNGFGADNVTTQIEGLGRIADIQAMYVAHTQAAMQ
ncbi:MAG: sirohydrochlorin cobaltochelatase [Lachnospiraceae bacterium]|nr:sirohydrochlorin cobaltochelatase [Lachnospiraceae bacterium]